MNYDYTECSKFVNKDKLYLENLNHISSNIYGCDNYSMTYNNTEIKISHNSNSNELKVKGSLPYFIEGQNFSNDMGKIKEAVYIISDTINTNLFDAVVKKFEAGITFESPFNPNEVFNSHYSIKGMETRAFKTGKIYLDANRLIKFYNAGKRIKKVLDARQRNELILTKGYKPEVDYLRLEVQHLKPEVYWKQRNISIADLFKEEFIYKCKKDIYNTYDMINKEGYYLLPKDKRDCTLPVIELLALKELGLKYGFNPEEYIKQKIKSIPESILTKEDKKNRKRSLSQLSSKLILDKESCYDLGSIIKDRLQID